MEKSQSEISYYYIVGSVSHPDSEKSPAKSLFVDCSSIRPLALSGFVTVDEAAQSWLSISTRTCVVKGVS